MTEADKIIQEGATKMHLDEAIKALESGDIAGAETHAQMAQDSQQQQQQQPPLPPPSNISQQLQQQQQPLLGQVMQQQQPVYQRPIHSTTAAVIYLSAAYSAGSADHSAATPHSH